MKERDRDRGREKKERTRKRERLGVAEREYGVWRRERFCEEMCEVVGVLRRGSSEERWGSGVWLREQEGLTLLWAPREGPLCWPYAPPQRLEQLLCNLGPSV